MEVQVQTTNFLSTNGEHTNLVLATTALCCAILLPKKHVLLESILVSYQRLTKKKKLNTARVVQTSTKETTLCTNNETSIQMLSCYTQTLQTVCSSRVHNSIMK